MVKWQGRRQSDNVEDRRGAVSGAGMPAAGLIVPILRFVIGKFGVGGIVVLIGGFFALQAIGLNPLALLAPTGPQTAAPQSAQSNQEFAFASVMLAETEDVWKRKFAEAGSRYAPPNMVIFTNSVRSACGGATSAAGPFYCPADKKVYLDTSFFNELASRFGAPGDFGGAYVIAHEVGHHIQTITGISAQVRQKQAAVGKVEQNALQVRMELQADCYAGIWAHEADRTEGILEEGDIDEGLRAASAIGDDTLQRNAGRRVTPESFTHGTSAQRKKWFMTGYRTGSVEACDTFSARQL